MGSPKNDGKGVTNPELSGFAIANDEQRNSGKLAVVEIKMP